MGNFKDKIVVLFSIPATFLFYFAMGSPIHSAAPSLLKFKHRDYV